MSGPTPGSPSPQDDLSKVIDALTAATQALTQATQVLRDISAQVGPIGLVGGGPAVQAHPATINTWEDDPFSEAAPTPNPAVSALIDQLVTGPSTNTALSWQITGAQPAAGQHQPGTPSSGTGTFRNPSPDASASSCASCLRARAGPASSPRSGWPWWPATT